METKPGKWMDIADQRITVLPIWHYFIVKKYKT